MKVIFLYVSNISSLGLFLKHWFMLILGVRISHRCLISEFSKNILLVLELLFSKIPLKTTLQSSFNPVMQFSESIRPLVGQIRRATHHTSVSEGCSNLRQVLMKAFVQLKSLSLDQWQIPVAKLLELNTWQSLSLNPLRMGLNP